MPTVSESTQVTIGGVQMNGTVSRSAASAIGTELSPTAADAFPAGTAGTLSTRTDNDTGTVTSNSHPFNDGDLVDVYWTGGRRYGMLVSSDAANTFVIGAVGTGSGDNLPIATTSLVVCKQQVINIDFDPTALKRVRVLSTVRGHIEFIDDADVSVLGQELTASEPWDWVSGQNITNPLTGDPIAEVRVSNGTTSAGTLKIGVLYDSTP